MSSYTWEYLTLTGAGPIIFSNNDGVPPTVNVDQSTLTLINAPDVVEDQVVFATPPVISTIQSLSGNILTLPTSNTTLIGNNTLDTLSNKSLVDTSVAIVDSADNNIKLVFDVTGTTSTTLTLSTSQTANRTLTLPDASDTLVGLATSDVLTNKTLTIPKISYNSTAPSGVAGSLVLFNGVLNGMNALGIQNNVEPIYQFRPSPAHRKYGLWTAQNSSLIVSTINFTATNSGTPVAAAFATTTNLNASKSITYPTTNAVNNTAGVRLTNAFLWRGSSPTTGGFFFSTRFGTVTNNAAQRLFAGVSSGALSGTAEPSANNNIIGIGADSTDTNWQMITRNTVSTTKINLGIPKIDLSNIVEISIYAASGAAGITYSLRYPSLSTFTLGYVSTTLPSNTTALAPIVNLNNGAGGGITQIRISSIYYETMYDF